MKLQIAITHFLFWLLHKTFATLEYGYKCQPKERPVIERKCVNNRFEKIHHNMKIQGTVIQSILSQSSLNCVHRCERIGTCKFVNHNDQSKVCELINDAESVIKAVYWNVFEREASSNCKTPERSEYLQDHNNLFQKCEEHPIEVKLIGRIAALTTSWQLSLDVLFTSFPSTLRGVVHLTVGCNEGVKGCRLPAILIKADDGNELELIMATNINDNDYKEIFDKVPLNVYHRITMTHLPAPEKVGKYILKMYLNGVLLKQEENDKPRRFSNVSIHTGSPYYPPAQGYIKNFWHITEKSSTTIN